MPALQPEVGRLMIEEDAQHPAAVVVPSAADDNTRERHGAAVPLDKPSEAWQVDDRILARQMPHEPAADEYLDRVGVVRVRRLVDQDGLDRVPDGVAVVPTHAPPDCRLIEGFSDDLERLAAAQQHLLSGRSRSVGATAIIDALPEAVEEPHGFWIRSRWLTK